MCVCVCACVCVWRRGQKVVLCGIEDKKLCQFNILGNSHKQLPFTSRETILESEFGFPSTRPSLPAEETFASCALGILATDQWNFGRNASC